MCELLLHSVQVSVCSAVFYDCLLYALWCVLYLFYMYYKVNDELKILSVS